MDPRNRKQIETIHRLGLKLEKSTTGELQFSMNQESLFDLRQLEHLKNLISNLSSSEDLDLARLASIEKHLTPGMTLKHFVSFMIPFERLLHKNLQDDDFLVSSQDHPAAQANLAKFPLVLVLDNIRSAFNVGSIFRTAECLGAKKIMLCGYTPLPTQWKVEKTAMGTEDYLEWEEGGKTFDCIQNLKQQGYWIIALETAEKAQDLYLEFPHQPTAFIFGNERFGLDPEILKIADDIRIIPLHGRKNSLNVGVTAAIAGFEWVRQWKIKK